MEKKFKVISIHPYTGGCNLDCPFCYVANKKPTKDTKSHSFWYSLIPYFKKLTEQVACGAAGEPFMDIPFIKEFAKRCKKAGLIFNTTTNGRLLMELTDKELTETLKNITMVSISFDEYKTPTVVEIASYKALVERIKALTGCQVGANLLITKLDMIRYIGFLFDSVGVDRVYALYPKNMPLVDILKIKPVYYLLSAKYKHLYLDDTHIEILTQNCYSGWTKPCHFFRDVISINQKGEVAGCSFEKKPLLVLKEPKDLLKITKIKAKKRYNCPFIGV
jgi:MoaA/NifB/PqqE/SkfB family radical SAM enzyme